jgi:hypothetical protein
MTLVKSAFYTLSFPTFMRTCAQLNDGYDLVDWSGEKRVLYGKI